MPFEAPHASLPPNAGFSARALAAAMAVIDRTIPAELLTTPESARRARLITRFGVLGSLFGIAYAIFYLLIDHLWGAVIILLCSSGVVATPFLMRWTKSTEIAGNFFAMTLTLGFLALCFVEGGVHGHAIAWLVSVPLCALLLIGRQSALKWVVLSFAASAVVIGFDLCHQPLAVTYDPKWSSLVSAAGYLGLIVFLSILGLIFETGRQKAFAKMQTALSDLATSNDRLVHLNNEKNEFLGIAAHDLKNPLTVILGSAELIGMTDNPQVTTKCQRNIVLAATRMRDLINTLLDANAIEQGRFNSHIEPCDVGALVQQCVDNNRTNATRKEINFRVGASEGLYALADRAGAMQVLDNLISNALKFSPPKTNVHLLTMPEQDFVLIAVRDEGPGIGSEDQKRLFQKFTRLSARPTAGESSTGLGLSIVKRLVEGMSGTIQCQSTLGLGTTFLVRLPLCPADRLPHANAVPPKPLEKAALTENAARTATQRPESTLKK